MAQERIELADGVTVTYGVGGEILNRLLSSYDEHRVNVLAGALDVSYTDAKATATDTASVLAAGKTSAIQDVYTVSGVGQFVFTATGATVFTVTGN